MTAAVEDSVEVPDGDLDTILPERAELVIGTNLEAGGRPGGWLVRVNRILTREIMLLLEVYGSGLGPVLSQMDVDWSDEQQAVQAVTAATVIALPRAQPQVMNLLGALAKPVDEADEEGRLALQVYLHGNPDPGDVLELIGVVAQQEGDNVHELLGKARAMYAAVSAAYKAKAKAREKKNRIGRGRGSST